MIGSGLSDRAAAQQRIESLEKEFALAKAALKNILDYGKALQPGPVHPVTFNACVIAQEALSQLEEKGAGTK